MTKGTNKLKKIDAPVYHYWEALYMSFYSGRVYVDIGKRWRGLGFLYLLLLIALLAIPFSIRMSMNFDKSFNQQLIQPLAQLPTLYVQNGNASFDKPMPYLIKNKEGQVVILVDTTGTVNDFSNLYPYLTILINKDKVSYRIPTPQLLGMKEEPPKGTPVVQSFTKGTNLVFNGKKIVEDNTILKLKVASQFLIYPIVIAILYSILLVIFLVLGFLGQVFSRIFFGFQITFKQGSRLLMVSATPMMLVFITMMTSNLIFPGFGFILVGLLTAYYSFALYSLRAESNRMTRV